MEITWGGLEDISRPASSERTRTGSRVSTTSLAEGVRINRASPTSLEVLSSDIIEDKVHTMVLEAKSFSENSLYEDCPSEQFPSDKETSQTDGSDEECEDLELQKAIKKMKRLDKILADRISKEKEVKKRGRELHQKLWEKLEVWLLCHLLYLKELTTRESNRDAIENTKMFLALTSSTSQESSEVPDVVPVFGTQIPEKEYKKHSNEKCVEGKELNIFFHSFLIIGDTVDVKGDTVDVKGDTVGEDGDKVSKADSKQTGNATDKQTQDFVKKNIKLASSGLHVPMTLDEKQRLSQLLQDIDDESADICGATDLEEMASVCTVSTRLGEGYTPQPLELDQLIQIDAKLQTLVAPEHFLSVRSPYPEHGLPQVQYSSVHFLPSSLSLTAQGPWVHKVPLKNLPLT
ncbi:hypothetical protein ACEWY4_005854 [Coilia grayii]|uniref:Fibrous sheath-interacting protein 1 n=1 Tax=Coilia grayii TaxID=363190 RepID=A0ABD1KJK6_9TELE